MEILNLLAPVFLLIALGAGLQRSGLLPVDLQAGLNRITYWVGLPVLIFTSLANAEHGEGEVGRLLLALLLGTLVSVLLAWGAARLLGLAVEAHGTFVQAAFRGNLAFVGLPLVLTMPGVPRTTAIFAMAPMLVVYNALAVGALLASQHRGSAGMTGIIGREIVRNPIVIASVLGGIFYVRDWHLPTALDRTLLQLARMAVPMALLCIGGALVLTPLKGNRRVAVAGAVFKTAVSPLIGYGVGRALGLGVGEMLVTLMLMACPTAAVSYTMVRQIGGDEAVAASVIVLSTLFSAGALAVILALA
ncbi:MAG TPA: AEC family transporter [Opitutaceae bacterium]